MYRISSLDQYTWNGNYKYYLKSNEITFFIFFIITNLKFEQNRLVTFEVEHFLINSSVYDGVISVKQYRRQTLTLINILSYITVHFLINFRNVGLSLAL